MIKKEKKLRIQFLINDGVEEEFYVPVSEMTDEEFQEEIERNIIALTIRQDNFLETWETKFPSETSDRMVYNKLDTDGYYQDGYMAMRKIDLKRAFFEARIHIIEG